MSAATQVYYAGFDAVFLKLPVVLRARIETKIDEIGSRLAAFPHYRLKGSNRFRARFGDDRIIDLERNADSITRPRPLPLSRHCRHLLIATRNVRSFDILSREPVERPYLGRLRNSYRE